MQCEAASLTGLLITINNFKANNSKGLVLLPDPQNRFSSLPQKSLTNPQNIKFQCLFFICTILLIPLN